MSDESFDLGALDAIPDPVSPAAASRPGPPTSWDAVSAKLGPTRTRGQIQREHVIALAFGVVWLATFAVLAGVRPHYEGITLVVQGAIPAIIALVTIALALTGGKLGFGARPTHLVAALVLAPVLFAAITIAVDVPHFADDPRTAESCGFVELGAGVVPGLALVWAHRRGMANGAGLRMAALGLGIGLLAAGMWALHCPDSTAQHVLLSHGLPALAIAGASAALAIKLGRIR